MRPARPKAPQPGLKRFLRILFRSTIFYAAVVCVTITVMAGVLHAITLFGSNGAEAEGAPKISEIRSLAALVFFVFAGYGFCVGWSWAIVHATIKRSTAIVAYIAGGPIGGLVLSFGGQFGAWASNCAYEPAICTMPEINIRIEYVAIASVISYILIAYARLTIGRAFRYVTWPID